MDTKSIDYDTNPTGRNAIGTLFGQRNGIGVGNITPDVVPAHRRWNIAKAFAEINREAGLFWHRHHHVLANVYMNMKSYIMAFCEKIRQRKEKRRIARCIDDSNHRIQIREFNGKLCIAIDNIPVVVIEEDWNAVDVLAKSRDTFAEYIKLKH